MWPSLHLLCPFTYTLCIFKLNYYLYICIYIARALIILHCLASPGWKDTNKQKITTTAGPRSPSFSSWTPPASRSRCLGRSSASRSTTWVSGCPQSSRRRWSSCVSPASCYWNVYSVYARRVPTRRARIRPGHGTSADAGPPRKHNELISKEKSLNLRL